jgi:multidrug efflux pump subunit AcrA (membrane-fusion protein)
VQPIPVTVGSVKSVGLRRTVPVVGTLNAYEDVQLAPKVDGRVVNILRDVGDAVAPGEVLLELDPTNHALAVEQARPAFQAELKKLKLDALPESDAEFTLHLPKVDAVAQARANLELAEKDLTRIEFEYSKGVAGVQVFDTAKTKVKVAKAAVELAETDARVTLSHARRLKAALDDAEDHLRETQLRAPVRPEWAAWSAVLGPAANPLRYSVASRMAEKGQMIRQFPLTNLFRLVLDHILKLRVTVPERYKPEVRVGQVVEVRVEAYPDRVFAGRVTRINPTVDSVSRSFMVEIEVPNYGRLLSAGGFAKADILTRTDAAVTTVSPEAVVMFAGVTKVFVAEGDVARAIEVEIGTRDKEWVEVRGALKPDARVILSGQTQLVDGSPIRIR